MQPTLDKVACEFRSAILVADHDRAASLARQYARALESHWNSMSADERATSLLPTQVSELLAWAQDVTVVQREMAKAHLDVIEKTKRYNISRSLRTAGDGV